MEVLWYFCLVLTRLQMIWWGKEKAEQAFNTTTHSHNWTQIVIYLYWCVCRRWEAGGSETRAACRRLTWLFSLCPLCRKVSHLCSSPLSACCIVSPALPSSLSSTSDAAMISRCSLWVADSIHYSIRQGSCLGAVLQCPILQAYTWPKHAERKHAMCVWFDKIIRHPSRPECCYVPTVELSARCPVLLCPGSWRSRDLPVLMKTAVSGNELLLLLMHSLIKQFCFLSCLK